MLKVEKLEDQIEIRDRFVNSIFNYIVDGKKELDTLDKNGYVPSDDEFGQIYKVIQTVIDNMYNFLSKYLITEDGTTTEKEEGKT